MVSVDVKHHVYLLTEKRVHQCPAGTHLHPSPQHVHDKEAVQQADGRGGGVGGLNKKKNKTTYINLKE